MLSIFLSSILAFAIYKTLRRWWAQFPLAFFAGVFSAFIVPVVYSSIYPDELTLRYALANGIQATPLNIIICCSVVATFKFFDRKIKNNQQKEML